MSKRTRTPQNETKAATPKTRRVVKVVDSAVAHDLAEVIDLDAVVVLDSRGRRITESDAARIAEQAISRVGRPSLTGTGQRSPAISFRVSAQTRHLTEQRAAAEGKTVSQIAREALERYVASA